MKKCCFLYVVLSILLFSCREVGTEEYINKGINVKNLEKILQEKLPLLGHRNWIVITDMAYPLQIASGITTVYSNKTYEQTLSSVMDMVNKFPHVYAHVYLDAEQTVLTEDLCPGITAYRGILEKELDVNELKYLPHEELLNKLESISQLYQVLIIKTPLLLPYTSVFLELDCNYWNAEKEALIVNKHNELYNISSSK